MLSKREKVKQQLESFVPKAHAAYVAQLIFSHPIQFKIVNPRSTKLGDFRSPFQGNKAQITVNGNLNKYAFLITTLHEFAHLNTYLKFKNSVKPHGLEWKEEFQNLIKSALEIGELPENIVNALNKSLKNTKASSCSDIQLTRVLKEYDSKNEDLVFLEKLPHQTQFELNGKRFIKGDLRRKRYLCQEVVTKKMYLVHALSEVKINETLDGK